MHYCEENYIFLDHSWELKGQSKQEQLEPCKDMG